VLRTKPPLLLAGLVVILIVAGVAAALACNSDDDSPVATPTATSVPPTTTSTATPESPTATPEPSVTPVMPTATVEATDIWSIEFQRTGGFAGLAQSLIVSSDGQAVYKDMRVERTEAGTLGPADLTELRSLIDASGFFTQPSPQNAPCADCFNLAITVTVDGATHTVQAVDIGLDPALTPLVDKLVTLLQDGLAP
jgi:Emfourin